MNPPVCVCDASVGVKWFRNESGTEAARELLALHIAGDVMIAVDNLFHYEVMRATSRHVNGANALRIWQDLSRMDLVTVPIGDELVRAASEAQSRLGCTLYDAFAAGLADLIGAPLYSADRRAHGAHQRCRIIE